MFNEATQYRPALAQARRALESNSVDLMVTAYNRLDRLALNDNWNRSVDRMSFRLHAAIELAA